MVLFKENNNFANFFFFHLFEVCQMETDILIVHFLFPSKLCISKLRMSYF